MYPNLYLTVPKAVMNFSFTKCFGKVGSKFNRELVEQSEKTARVHLNSYTYFDRMRYFQVFKYAVGKKSL